jgi:hypothetical protein
MGINRAGSSVKRAFERHGKIFGDHENPDVRKYEKLNLGQFSNIVEEYGLTEALRYMKDMEMRRMGAK